MLAMAACSDEVQGGYTVGEQDNAICLSAGVQSGSNAAESRATIAGHYAFTQGTPVRLHVEGTWAGKTPELIQKNSIYTTGTKDGDENALTYSSLDHLYWDDFGTADPGNTANRANGLDIYGVAVDGQSSAPEVMNWDADLAWNVQTDGTAVLTKDIIVSNNLSQSATPQNRYTFDEQKAGTDPEQSRLDFKHMLSRVTFVVKAGAGFADGKFAAAPVVTLTRNKSGESNAEWCYITGKVNLKAATTTPVSVGTVVLQPIEGGATAQVTETALIYPGSNFGDADADVVAQVNAAQNIYYVTAKEIRAAIGGSNFTAKPGYHYIFTVTINKTDVNVTATITQWQTLNAAEAAPAIVVTAEVGTEDNTTLTLPDFRFYYNDAATPGTGTYPKNVTFTAKADALNPEAGHKADGATHWHFYPVDNTSAPAISLYWPDHTRHYFFRGVYPTATAVVQDGETCVAVWNEAYDATSFPSNLMIGAPEINHGTMCDNPDHTPVDMSQSGICARTGAINLNFRYMMSRVEVELKTTSGDDRVNINDRTKVELLNVNRKGKVYLGERNTVASDLGTYMLNVTGSALRHSAIVPQTFAEGLKFKITVTNANGTTDVYYATVKDIKVEGSYITAWKSGKHYKYTLKLKKTGIAVTATVTDWVTATGSDDIWL